MVNRQKCQSESRPCPLRPGTQPAHTLFFLFSRGTESPKQVLLECATELENLQRLWLQCGTCFKHQWELVPLERLNLTHVKPSFMASPPKPQEPTALFARAFLWTLFTLPIPSALKLSGRTLLILERGCPQLKKHPSAHHLIRGVSQDHSVTPFSQSLFSADVEPLPGGSRAPCQNTLSRQGEVRGGHTSPCFGRTPLPAP